MFYGIKHGVLLRENNTKLRYLLLSVLFLLLSIYFLYFIIHGDRGYAVLERHKKELKQLEQILSIKKEENKKLETRILRLQESSLDKDFLDERVRKELGFGTKQDAVIFLRGENHVSSHNP